MPPRVCTGKFINSWSNQQLILVVVSSSSCCHFVVFGKILACVGQQATALGTSLIGIKLQILLVIQSVDSGVVLSKHEILFCSRPAAAFLQIGRQCTRTLRGLTVLERVIYLLFGQQKHPLFYSNAVYAGSCVLDRIISTWPESGCTVECFRHDPLSLSRCLILLF